ncbi:hypothetical protein Tco_1006625 [Tanacetum coccineum]|uniref:Uncharacterized protein n=1 Tax=Tanacetum coccineum TaxID=301880 RepID=A0ABQ5FID6_9ASTR
MTIHLKTAEFNRHEINFERAEVEEADRERACFLGGKISLGRKKSQDSNIDDSGNTGDGGKIVGGAIGACGSG